MSQLVRKTFAVTRSVTVSQPVVPLQVIEVLRADDGTFDVVRHACVGIETRLLREYTLVVPRDRPAPRPTRLDARTLREEGWEYDSDRVEHAPMFVDRVWGPISVADPIFGSDVAFFATYANDPDFDAKLADAKEGLEMSAKAKGGAPPETQAPAV